MTSLNQARAIEAAVRDGQIEIGLVQPDYNTVDVFAHGISIRCKEYRGQLWCDGPFLVNFSMPVPQWFTVALAGGAFVSAATRRAWDLDSQARATEIEAGRDPEGLDAEAADRGRA